MRENVPAMFTISARARVRFYVQGYQVQLPLVAKQESVRIFV